MAFEFLDSNSASIDLPANQDSITDLPDSDWTIGGWWRAQATGWSNNGSTGIYVLGSAGPESWFYIVGGNNSNLETFQARFDGDGTDATINTTTEYDDTNWHHILVQRISGVMHIYVDGVDEANATISGTRTTIDNHGFGFINGDVSLLTDSEMAEWAKWNRALTADEITALSLGYSPDHFPEDLMWYVPMIREYQEVMADLTVTNNSTTVVASPPIIYPESPIVFAAQGAIEYNPVDSLAISFDHMATIDNEFNPVGTIPIAFDSVAQIAGGIINPLDNIPLSFSALANIVGDLFNPVDDLPIGFDGTGTIVGDLRNPIGSVAIAFGGTGNIAGAFNPSDLLSISFNSSASITFGNVVFKWSTEHVVADTSLGRPIAYVDINSETQPTGAFPTGVAYDRRLISMPTLSELNLTSRSGITGFQRLTIEVDNADGILNGLDLQSAFIRIIMVNESGTVINEFKGVIVDWVLGVVSVINMEDLDAVVFEGQI